MLKKLIVLVIPVILATACSNAENKTANSDSTTSAENESSATNCYLYASQKDTAFLELIREGENVNGTLIFNYYEKDKNTGTIKGKIKNNFLIADYTFMSEGMESVRQVVFKIENGFVTEGYGEILLNDAANFENVNSLEFPGTMKLKETGCDK
jgi:hypothetical protein